MFPSASCSCKCPQLLYMQNLIQQQRHRTGEGVDGLSASQKPPQSCQDLGPLLAPLNARLHCSISAPHPSLPVSTIKSSHICGSKYGLVGRHAPPQAPTEGTGPEGALLLRVFQKCSERLRLRHSLRVAHHQKALASASQSDVQASSEQKATAMHGSYADQALDLHRTPSSIWQPTRSENE